METRIEELRAKLREYDILKTELDKFEEFIKMPQDKVQGVSLTNHYVFDDCGEIRGRARDRTVYFHGLSSLSKKSLNEFIKGHLATLRLRVSELEKELSSTTFKGV